MLKTNKKMEVKIRAKTDGSGHWSTAKRTVHIDKLEIGYINDEKDFGELCAYFDQETWNVYTDGLIYTDEQWLDEFKIQLLGYGFSPDAIAKISYSEQGMQTYSYVSLDVDGPLFYEEWVRITGEVYEPT